ncbi:RNA-binding protein 25-like [Uloborus diversus]|uniref:RNA-binding protein 25-like n=1 Tax=Uloborus diversus TaxID=327109 RepID=UPI002409CD79|nr:RNA-binding protein 25-like [Uloborus diversus]
MDYCQSSIMQDKDSKLFNVKALPVNENVPIDLTREPRNGHEYLLRARLEASRVLGQESFDVPEERKTVEGNEHILRTRLEAVAAAERTVKKVGLGKLKRSQRGRDSKRPEHDEVGRKTKQDGLGGERRTNPDGRSNERRTKQDERRTKPDGHKDERTKQDGQQDDTKTKPDGQRDEERTKQDGYQDERKTKPDGQREERRAKQEDQREGRETKPDGQRDEKRMKQDGHQDERKTKPDGQRDERRTKQEDQREGRKTKPDGQRDVRIVEQDGKINKRSPKQDERKTKRNDFRDRQPEAERLGCSESENEDLFLRIHDELSRNKSELQKKFPKKTLPLEDKKRCCLFCLGSELYSRIYKKRAKKCSGHLPLLSYVIHLDEEEVLLLFQYCYEWYLNVGINETIARWLYALLACLDHPISKEQAFGMLESFYLSCFKGRCQDLEYPYQCFVESMMRKLAIEEN